MNKQKARLMETLSCFHDFLLFLGYEVESSPQTWST